MEEIKDPLNFLETANNMCLEGKRPQGIDLIYDTVDDLLIEHKLDEVIKIINEAINMKEKLVPSIQLSIITITNAFNIFGPKVDNSDNLETARQNLIQELKNHWDNKFGIEETNQLLSGFIND